MYKHTMYMILKLNFGVTYTQETALQMLQILQEIQTDQRSLFCFHHSIAKVHLTQIYTFLEKNNTTYCHHKSNVHHTRFGKLTKYIMQKSYHS